MTNLVERMAASEAKKELNSAFGELGEIQRRCTRLEQPALSKDIECVLDQLKNVNEWLYALAAKNPS